MKRQHWIPGLIMMVAISAATLSAPVGHTQSAPARGAQAPVKQYQSPKRAQLDDEGGRIFQENCARCHRSPDGFSPRISGTIVRHMRVRANLSEHDEQLLLKYFNQ